MQVSQRQESIIAEEQHIHIGYDRRVEAIKQPNQYKYASVNEIKLFERASELHNQALIENRPLLFTEDDFTPAHIYFSNDKGKQTYLKDHKPQSSSGLLESTEDSLSLQVPVSNIHRQNTLVLELKNLKRRFPLEIQHYDNEQQRGQVRYKYLIVLNEANLSARVLVELNGSYKVWKEIEVPLAQNRFTLEITEFNNEQTDLKINDFLFHLILKMPFHEQTNFHLVHNNKVEIEKIEFRSISEKRLVSSKETYCSKQCQLI